MPANGSRPPAHRGLLLGLARQPCGEGSVGGPVGGVDGVIGKPFLFCYSFVDLRLSSSLHITFPRRQTSVYRFIDCRLGQPVLELPGQTAVHSVHWARTDLPFPLTFPIAKRVVSSVTDNGTNTAAYCGLMFRLCGMAAQLSASVVLALVFIHFL